MDPFTALGVAIALMRNLPGTASAQAAQVLKEAQEVLSSIPDDYTALIERVEALEDLGFYLDEQGFVCQN